MTERKPPGMRFESWVDKQIREATERGAFDNLPGAGRPLPVEDRPDDPDWWVRQLAKRERLSVLPTPLALRKEVEDLPEGLARESSERRVRAVVDDLNTRIRAELRRPQTGPPMTTMPLDVERAVQAWRDGRRAAGKAV